MMTGFDNFLAVNRFINIFATSLISLEKLWNVLIMMIMLNQESNDSNRLAIIINNAYDNSGRINRFGQFYNFAALIAGTAWTWFMICKVIQRQGERY